MCGVQHDKLTETDEIQPLTDWRAEKRSMLHTFASCLDDEREVIYGEKKVIKAWELQGAEVRLHFPEAGCLPLSRNH